MLIPHAGKILVPSPRSDVDRGVHICVPTTSSLSALFAMVPETKAHLVRAEGLISVVKQTLTDG